MLRSPLISFVAVILAASACTRAFADSILLASFDTFEGGSGAPETRFEVQVVLRHDFFDPPHDPVALGHGIWWADGDTGVVDFTSAGHTDFDRFAARLTGLTTTLLASSWRRVAAQDTESWNRSA
ncbi:MAG: hypothetical protein HOP29_01295 [Phycisphaerales bacterium]|nr:hypothetical protein [Phycisphaerales bacterium]